MIFAQLFIALVALVPSVSSAKLAGECASICNDLRHDVLTLSMCKEAKKILPRPKVGDFCSVAMEQGFSDACIPLCMGEVPVPRIAQACRAASMEMPRPTIRKWCEHGYKQGYHKTSADLKSHFAAPAANVFSGFENGEGNANADLSDSTLPTKQEERKIVETIPVTLDDNTLDLNLYEGQSPEDAVAEFCHTHVADDPSGCIRQLLPVVLDREQSV